MTAEAIRIVEVGPRAGLQNESLPVDTQTKVRLSGHLVCAGFAEIEAVSLVSPRWVPQMEDGAAMLSQVPRGRSVKVP